MNNERTNFDELVARAMDRFQGEGQKRLFSAPNPNDKT